jgi:hypothetical protein
MQSLRMPLAAYDTLCKVVVRKQRDLWRFFGAAQLLCVARCCNRRAQKRHGGSSQQGCAAVSTRQARAQQPPPRQARPQRAWGSGNPRQRARRAGGRPQRAPGETCGAGCVELRRPPDSLHARQPRRPPDSLHARQPRPGCALFAAQQLDAPRAAARCLPPCALGGLRTRPPPLLASARTMCARGCVCSGPGRGDGRHAGPAAAGDCARASG